MNKLVSGRRLVSDILIPIRLSDTPLVALRVDVLALAANTGTIRVGGETVNTIADRECGIPLDAEDIATFSDVDLHECWIAADTADDGVTWTATVNV